MNIRPARWAELPGPTASSSGRAPRETQPGFAGLLTRLLAGLVLALSVGGCATWRSYDAGPGLSTGQSLPYYLRATRGDSSRTVLAAPFVRADTLYGRSGGEKIGVPVADIVHLERQQANPGRTAAVIVGVPVVSLGVAYVILCGIRDCTPVY